MSVYSSTCNGAATPLVVTLPTGTWEVTSVDVAYDITAANGAYMSEQRSKLACQETGNSEGAFISGSGSSAGTYNYTRTGLTIANGIYSGDLTFELQVYRTWGGTGCESSYQVVNDGTWTVTVNYQTPPSCPPPTALTATSTPTGADLGWILGGSETTWDLYIVPAGDPAPDASSTPTMNDTGNPSTWSGGAANTAYDAYVRADCAGDNTDVSVWVGPVSFTTTPTNDNMAGAIPITPSPEGTGCSTFTFTAKDANDGTTDSGLDGTCNGTDTGLDRFYSWTATTDALIWNDGASNPGIVIRDDQGNEITCQGTYAGDDIELTGWAINDNLIIQIYDFGAANDEVTFCLELFTLPSCYQLPTNLSAAGITASAADFSWTANGSESVWDLYIVPAGDPAPDASSTPTMNDTGNPSTWSGGTANTAYDAYVRADCAGDNTDVSTWVGPVSFTTLCPVKTPDYLEDFATFVPDCWDEASNGDPASGPSDLGAGDWLAEEFAHSSTSGLGAVNVNLYNTGTSDWVLSPYFDLSGGSYELKLDVALTSYNNTAADNMGSDDEVQLLYTEDGSTWINLMTWDSGNQPATAGETVVIPLSSTGTEVQFGIWASEGTVDDAEDYDFHFDNFIIQTPPACPEPLAFMSSSVTSSGADLGWTAGGSEGVWDLYIVPAGDPAPDASSTPTMNDIGNPSTWSGGAANTAYDAYVRADCAGDNTDVSVWVGPVSFSTLCSAMNIPYTDDFENGISCWLINDVNGDGSTWSNTTSCEGNGLRAAYNSSNPMDDWAFSPEFLLTGGTEYLISFNSGNNSTSYTEKLEVFLMDAADPSAANQIMIYNDDNISDGACNSSDIRVTAPAGWTNYYVGFHGYSIIDQYFLLVDDFSIDVAPTQATWTVDDNNANSCDLIEINGVSGSVWHDVYNGADLVASINPNGENLGTVFVEMRDAAVAVEEYSEQGTTDMKKTLPKFFNLDSDNTFASDVTIRLYFTDGELADFNASSLGTGVTTHAAGDIDITHYDGLSENCDFSDNDASGTYTLVDNASITVGAVASGFYLEFDVGSFSEFLAHEPAAAPLPVELVRFSGKAMDSSNRLEWSTESERNSEFFVVERSLNGFSEFETIGKVSAMGFSNVLMDYSFEDELPMTMGYYRLKMVDLDGSYEYSNIISIERESKGFELLSVFPVPTQSSLNVQFSTNETSEVTIEISNVTGQVVSLTTIQSLNGIQQHQIDVSGINSGTYFVKISDGKDVKIQRFVKQ